MCFAVWISRSESASSVGMGSQTDAARFDRMTKKKPLQQLPAGATTLNKTIKEEVK